MGGSSPTKSIQRKQQQHQHHQYDHDRSLSTDPKTVSVDDLFDASRPQSGAFIFANGGTEKHNKKNTKKKEEEKGKKKKSTRKEKNGKKKMKENKIKIKGPRGYLIDEGWPIWQFYFVVFFFWSQTHI